MTDYEYIKIGREYWPVAPGRGTHVVRRGRCVEKDYWSGFIFDFSLALVAILAVPALLGLVCALCGAG